MSAVTRGVLTNFRFLADLLPESEYEQKVFEKETYYSIECVSKNRETLKQWDYFCDAVRSRFEDRLMEIYSITSDGVHFIIYVRK